MMKLIADHFYILSLFILSGKCSNITVYEYANYKGANLSIPFNSTPECKVLPDTFKQTVSSIKTDICINLYAANNCSGEKNIRLQPGSSDHNDLSSWNFDNTMESLHICSSFINFTNRRNFPEKDYITLWDKKGEKLHLNVLKSCQNVPQNWKNRTIATETFQQCYIFYSGEGCTGRMPLIIYKTDSSYNNLSNWRFENLLKSVAPCTANINSTKTSRHPAAGKRSIAFISFATVVITLLLIVIGGIVLFFVYFRKRTHSLVAQPESGEVCVQYLSKKYISNFLQGNPSALYAVPFDNVDSIHRAQNMPYDSQTYEIPIECLQIDWMNPLGSGEFGAVYRATVISHNGKNYVPPLEVAVKTVKAGADPEYVKALLDELKIMIYLNANKSNHPHIINLIGACTENLYRMEPYIVLELCSQGSLQNYLRKRRKSFINSINHSQASVHHYYNVAEGQNTLNLMNLMKWSFEIADGMEFLASKKIIHGDLAARNVLLDEGLNAKITDFGLSKQLYQYTQYVKNQQIPLPWRWLAIEALQDTNFSTSSDVWAFGITLYEIFTLGETPYPGIMYSAHFLASLKDGYRMPIPKYAPTAIYDAIMECWREAPEERPTFTELRTEIYNIMGDLLVSEN